MGRQRIASNRKRFWIVLMIALCPVATAGQDLEAKLAQRADFIPPVGSVREQLVQVAQHYKIPMGIEWVLQPEDKQVRIAETEAPTVMTLLTIILQAAPDYSINVNRRVVNVSQSRYAVDSRNFLNLRIDEFSATKANVFDAEAKLRSKIREKLHPELFVGGMNGGYGYGSPDENGLDVQNISFAGKNLTVRSILDRIILNNGNTLWLVNIAPPGMMKNEPFFAQFEANEEGHFLWRIIPFTQSTQK